MTWLVLYSAHCQGGGKHMMRLLRRQWIGGRRTRLFMVCEKCRDMGHWSTDEDIAD